MYLPVYVYDYVAGKKKNQFSPSTFFLAKLPPVAFLLGQQADGQSSGLEVPLLCAGNQEEPQPQLAEGLAEAGTGRHFSSLLASQASQLRKAGIG